MAKLLDSGGYLFSEELSAWGPNSDRTATRREAVEYCAWLARSHYENFPVVTWLLPRKLHQHFYCVYAWCRWADDLGDEIGDTSRALELLAWWRQQTRDCFDGKAVHPVLVALQDTLAAFAIPFDPFDRLISAFEQDQRIVEYETYSQLADYCTRSANPVGELVLCLMKSHCVENVELSDSICTGLQLANFWQDVARDADMGRTYLPAEDRQRFGYGDDDLKNRVTNNEFLQLMKYEVDRAEQLIRAGLDLPRRLSGRIAVDIDLFARGGLCILDRIRKIEYRVWETRPVVKKSDILLAACGAVARAALRMARFR